jgi:hypothetical protein
MPPDEGNVNIYSEAFVILLMLSLINVDASPTGTRHAAGSVDGR